MQNGVNIENLVECNEIGAIVSPVVPPGADGVEMIGEVLGVNK